MLGLFKKIDERKLTGAVVVFGGSFYKCLRQHIDMSDVDMPVMETEFPMLAISVSNAFIGMGRKDYTKIMAANTQNAAMAYGVQIAQVTNGQVDAAEYASRLTTSLADGDGMEYTRIVCEEPPGNQPQQLISHFLERVNASIPASVMDEIIAGVATALSKLIDDLPRAGI